MRWRRLQTLMVREVRATLRDPFTLGMLVAVPLAALLVFGFTISTEVKGIGLGVYDQSQTAASRRVLADIVATDNFIVQAFPSRPAIDRAFRRGQVSAAVIIPPDFDRDLRDGGTDAAAHIQILYDGAETLLAGNVEASLRGTITASIAALGGPQRMPAPASGGVEVLVSALFNPTFDGVPYMVAGTFGFVLTFLTTLLTAVSVVNERLGGTFEQLQVTPATGLEIVLGKLLPLGGVFTFDVVLMVLAAGFLLGVWPHGSAPLFVAVSSFYVLLSLALGLIISATSSTAAEAVQKTVLTSIPLVQLSGFAFPVRNMPLAVQWLTEVFPATHYIRISRAIYLRGEGLTDLLPEIAMLALFGVLLLRKALTSVEARA
ncbi:MAG TPA: ABC transporter permease [Candidatus Dormibacteraeota bacterium]|nr:ABC transporter permease [Candidatus Dormibacteraeota bacterium]